MSDTIDYGNKMHRAMRGLIAEVLEDVGANGLPGEHHFFITFDTRHPDVEMADWLFDRYPTEMTIVVQHWFDNLIVTDIAVAQTWFDQGGWLSRIDVRIPAGDNDLIPSLKSLLPENGKLREFRFGNQLRICSQNW